MQPPHARRIITYGHDKNDPDCRTPEVFREFIRNISTENQGRYRYTIGKDADVIVLSLDGLAYGHFNIESKVEPTTDDRKAFPAVKHVYLVESGMVYATPVRLSERGIEGIQFGKQLTEEQFREIETAGGDSFLILSAR
jgi:hypothetical protein